MILKSVKKRGIWLRFLCMHAAKKFWLMLLPTGCQGLAKKPGTYTNNTQLAFKKTAWCSSLKTRKHHGSRCNFTGKTASNTNHRRIVSIQPKQLTSGKQTHFVSAFSFRSSRSTWKTTRKHPKICLKSIESDSSLTRRKGYKSKCLLTNSSTRIIS